MSALTSVVLAQISQPSIPQTNGGPGQAPMRALLDTYCLGCHNSRARAGGVAFDMLTLDAVGEHADVWEAALRKLRGRLMPPPTSRQPEQREIDAFIAAMEARLDAAAAGGRVAGHVPIQRLTRTEFATAVNDLLGIPIDAEKLLPAEIEVHRFDNIAAALSVSPAFLDQYVAAARQDALLAVGDPAKPTSAHYHQAPGFAREQAGHIDGLPLGTRGGMKFRDTFPADREYRFTIPDVGIDLYTFALETRHTLIILIDGREVFRQAVGGPEDEK